MSLCLRLPLLVETLLAKRTAFSSLKGLVNTDFKFGYFIYFGAGVDHPIYEEWIVSSAIRSGGGGDTEG